MASEADDQHTEDEDDSGDDGIAHPMDMTVKLAMWVRQGMVYTYIYICVCVL